MSSYQNNINTLFYGIAQKQKRAHEDRYQVAQIGPLLYFAVFDGHGGAHQMSYKHVGDVCVRELHELLSQNLEGVDYNNINTVQTIIINTFIELDTCMHKDRFLYGSTCTMILVDIERNLLYQVNLGDSRSIIFCDNQILAATVDHEPTTEKEMNRILEAGGYVSEDGRVDGNLMISRSFGDFDLKYINGHYDPIKGKVSAVPDVTIFDISPCPSLNVILTSDGPYDKFTDPELVEMFYNLSTDTQRSLTEIANDMVNIITPHTTDDVTLILAII